jgi:hypothetical protein
MELNDYNKSIILEQLAAGPVVVTFTKKDGTERIMPCTTSPTIIMFKTGGKDISAGSTPNALADKVASVYDLEVDGWRSFRWDSLKTAVVA